MEWAICLYEIEIHKNLLSHESFFFHLKLKYIKCYSFSNGPICLNGIESTYKQIISIIFYYNYKKLISSTHIYVGHNGQRLAMLGQALAWPDLVCFSKSGPAWPRLPSRFKLKKKNTRLFLWALAGQAKLSAWALSLRPNLRA